jgi:O-antigen ligase
VIALLAAAFWWLSREEYFASIWQFANQDSLIDYVTSIYAAPRLAYIVGGFKIFNLHPWFGVGLGGSSFYLFDNLPNWALVDPYEIARQVSPDSTVMPNVRNLLVRLLSETGIVGFWMYMAFMLSILGTVRRMFLSRKQVMVYASVAGLAILLSVLIRQLTLSTLTSPTIWISLGAVVGYAHHIMDVPSKTGAVVQKEESED